MRRLVFIDDDPLLLESDPALLREGRRPRSHGDDEWELRACIDRLDVLEEAWEKSNHDLTRSTAT